MRQRVKPRRVKAGDRLFLPAGSEVCSALLECFGWRPAGNFTKAGVGTEITVCGTYGNGFALFEVGVERLRRFCLIADLRAPPGPLELLAETHKETS